MQVISALCKVHRRCNNRCLFCHCHRAQDGDGGPRPAAEELPRMLDPLPDAVERVLLSGGEPTLHPEILPLLQGLTGAGLRSGLVTNGRRLGYASFCAEVLARGADYFYVSLHSHEAAVHDAIVGDEGAWVQTVAALRNLARAPHAETRDVVVNCVVVDANARQLAALAGFVKRLGLRRVKFSVPELKGRAATAPPGTLCTLRDAALCIEQGLSAAESLGLAPSYDGLPYCLLPASQRARGMTLETEGILYMREVEEDRYHPTDESRREKRPECLECSFHAVCEGVYAGYAAQLERLPALSAVVPNYAELTADPEADGPRSRAGHPRAVLFADGDAVRRCTLRSDFFKALTLRRLRETGQLYRRDPGADPGPTGLGNLRPLEPGSADGAIPLRGADGGGLLAPSAAIRDALSRVRGEVLDIGYGARTLGDQLPLRDPDAIRYTGVEPDPTAHAEARAEVPEATLVNQRAEQMRFPDGAFDWVLMLGSYQHIRDLPAVLRAVRRLLRAEGRLLVVENPVFGVVSLDPAPGDRALPPAAGAEGWEHYRNHEGAEARALLERCGFQVLEDMPAPPGHGLWGIEAAPAAPRERP